MDNFPTDTLHDGPTAHEDLTIAEQLDFMRITEKCGPGVECFLAPDGKTTCFQEDEVQRFIAEHGAEHSSNYLRLHATDWQEDFFQNCKLAKA